MPIADWEPTVDDVGAILRARTKDDNGRELGTFTSETRPTDEQVGSLINKATASVAMRIGSDIPPQTFDDAKSVSATLAAMRVELTYFPEQINTNRSAYAQLKGLYDDDLKALILAVTKAGGDAGEAGAPFKPAFEFPMTGDPLIIGRRTAW